MGKKKQGGSSECVEADLLCDEEATSLGFDDGGGAFMGEADRIGEKSGQLIDVPFVSDECFGWMIEREKDYLPRNDYLERLRSGELDLSLRRDALDWMLKACVHHGFGEVCLYSCVNYFDRFLSVYDLPAGKTWATQLVAVACLLLAAKMHEVNVPNTLDLQCGLMEHQGEPPRFLFEATTMKRMEMLLLNILKWNINPCTPLNFVEYFLQKGNCGDLRRRQWIARSSQLVARIIKGIDFLEFRPSEIAAAVTSYVSGETQPFIEIEKGRVIKCLNLIQDLMTTTSSLSSVTNSPNGVLEAEFWSCGSDENVMGSWPSCSSADNTPDAKRRKMD